MTLCSLKISGDHSAKKKKIHLMFLVQGCEVLNEIVAGNHLASVSLRALVQRGTLTRQNRPWLIISQAVNYTMQGANVFSR